MKTHITQLLDFTKVDALLEGFNQSTGFVTAILDLEGNVLSKSGWRRICTDFHRIHPTTACNCTISDTALANKMGEGEKYHFYKCLNGLVDVAMPIVLNNEHVANLFSGQFFFEEPDREFFRQQAQKYGFDEEKYLDALGQVPIVSEEKVKSAMDFLHQMLMLIIERSLEKVELLATKEKIEETSANLTAIIEGTSDSIWAFDKNYCILYLNNVFQRDFLASFGVLLEKGSNLLTSLPEAIRHAFKVRYDRVFNNEQFTIIDEVETALGNLYIQITFNPIVANNEVIGGSCFGSNITERKSTEIVLRESESQFRGLFDFAADAIFIADIETGIILHANEKAALLTKRPVDELIGKHQSELHPPEKNTSNKDTFQQHIQEVSNKNFTVAIEKTVLCSDGTQVPVEIIASEVSYKGKKCLMGIFRDISERKLAEESSKELLKRFELIGTHLPGVIYQYRLRADGSSHFPYASQGISKIYGVTPEEVEHDATNVFKVIHPDDLEQVSASIKLSAQTLNPWHDVYRVNLAYGNTIWVEGNSTPIKLEDGSIIWHGFIQDITERKLIEESLLKSEERFQLAMKASNDGLFDWNLETNAIYYSPSWKKMLGYEDHELPNDFSVWETTTAPEDVKKSWELHQKLIKKQVDRFVMEFKMKHKDGHWVEILSRAEAIFNENDKAIRIVGTHKDITDRKKSENQLRKLSQAVEQSPASVVITDLKGNIEYVNPKFIEATGYSSDEVIGQNPRVLKSGEQSADYYKELWETIQSGKEWKGEFHNKKKNGELFWESASISPIKNENGETINYLAIKEDITERKAMETQLNETMGQVQRYAKHLQKVREEEKALLAREIHDELGQLLVALKMDTGVTTKQYNKAVNDEDKEKIKEKLVKHADMITKAISSARRIMYGLRPVKLEMLGFAGACEEYIEDFSTRYEIKFDTDIDLDIEKLDEERSLAMYRILQETTMNIVKHAQATKAEIKYYQAGNEIVFEVKDNGIGFTVGKDGREDSYGLLGINERVTLLKGTLNISSSPGNGTRVVVRFPM